MPGSLKFGTSGLRGLASELIGPESRRYTAAFLAVLARRGVDFALRPVLVGWDLRHSSPAIASAVLAEIAQQGAEAMACGELPTPALALAALAGGNPAIMITGSHIPADRNGLKFYLPEGEIKKADEAAIIAALAPVGPETVRPQPARESAAAMERYRRRYLDLWPADLLRGMRIGVFQHSTVARDVLIEMLEKLGASVLPLGRADRFVAIDTEAVSASVAGRCRDWVAADRLDALVSADGDADRPLMADDTGRLVRGDIVGTLTARYLGADAVVTPVTSNSAIEASRYFRQVLRTKVGSPHVIAGMREAAEKGAERIVGFEANGGVLLGSDLAVGDGMLTALPTRDAVLPILAVLAETRRLSTSLSRLVAGLPQRFASSGRLENVASERGAAFVSRLDEKAFAAAFLSPVGHVAGRSDVDGPRFTLEGGDIVHFRPSGNAPELRCYTEGATARRADELLEWGLKAAEAAIAGAAE